MEPAEPPRILPRCRAAEVQSRALPLRGARPGPPVAIAPSRCNRCGACLSLACAAISDGGGEALEIDPAICTGCGLCARLCRGGAIAAVR